MPTTTKGLPYPLSTAPPNVPVDLKDLAEALDFSRIPQLVAAQYTATTPLETYPLGLSVIGLSLADATAGGWPAAGNGQILTIKSGTARASQFLFRHGPVLAAYYRGLAAAPGPHSPWASASAPYGTYVGSVTLDASANPTAGVVVTFPAGRFTVGPRVVTGSQNSAWFPSVTSITATSCTVLARQIVANASNPIIHIMAAQATDQSVNG